MVRILRETVAHGERAVGQLELAHALYDAARTLRRLQAVLDIGLVEAKRLRNHGRIEIDALHAGRHQQSQLVFGKLFELGPDDGLDRFRRSLAQLAGGARQFPAVPIGDDESGVANESDQLHHEQRIAGSLRAHERAEFGGEA